MDLQVNTTDYFTQWWLSLSEDARQAIYIAVQELMAPDNQNALLEATESARMCELSVSHEGYLYRVLYAFDANHQGIVLVGGKQEQLSPPQGQKLH